MHAVSDSIRIYCVPCTMLSGENMGEKDNITDLKEVREGAEGRSLEMSLSIGHLAMWQVSTTLATFQNSSWLLRKIACSQSGTHVYHDPATLLTLRLEITFPETPSLHNSMFITSDLKQIGRSFFSAGQGTLMLGSFRCCSLVNLSINFHITVLADCRLPYKLIFPPTHQCSLGWDLHCQVLWPNVSSHHLFSASG